MAGPKPDFFVTPVDLGERRALRQEKIRALHFIAAYLVAVKHHLRAELGTSYPDFDGLLPDYFLKYDHELANVHEHTGAWESPVDTSGTTTPHPTRIRDVGTSQTTCADQRTPLLKDHHHIVHFPWCVRIIILRTASKFDNVHSIPPPQALSLPLMFGRFSYVVYHLLTLFPTHSIAHELTRLVHGFQCKGYLDAVGPAGELHGCVVRFGAKLTARAVRRQWREHAVSSAFIADAPFPSKRTHPTGSRGWSGSLRRQVHGVLDCLLVF
jgi:hypothetical protein